MRDGTDREERVKRVGLDKHARVCVWFEDTYVLMQGSGLQMLWCQPLVKSMLNQRATSRNHDEHLSTFYRLSRVRTDFRLTSNNF